MSKISEDRKSVLYHKVYNLIYDSPRIPLFRISQKLGISRNSAARYLKEMYEKGILFGPEMRLKSFPALEEYCYFLKADEPLSLYEELKNHTDLIYECMSIGDWDLLLMTSKPANFSSFDGVEVLAGGKRGDFFYSKPKLQTWEKAYDNITKMIENSSGEERSTLQENRENPSWGEEEWRLFHEFKYDLRKKALPVLKKHRISWEKYESWVKSLPRYATIFSNFYPEGYGNYMDVNFLVESNYEKQIIEIFGGLPTSSILMKIRDKIYMILRVKKENIDIERILKFMEAIKEKDMIKRYEKAIAIIYFRP